MQSGTAFARTQSPGRKPPATATTLVMPTVVYRNAASLRTLGIATPSGFLMPTCRGDAVMWSGSGTSLALQMCRDTTVNKLNSLPLPSAASWATEGLICVRSGARTVERQYAGATCPHVNLHRVAYHHLRHQMHVCRERNSSPLYYRGRASVSCRRNTVRRSTEQGG